MSSAENRLFSAIGRRLSNVVLQRAVFAAVEGLHQIDLDQEIEMISRCFARGWLLTDNLVERAQKAINV